jgi:hypothetical protein
MAEEREHVDFDLDGPNSHSCTVSRAEQGEGRFVSHRYGISRYAHVKVVVARHPGIHCYRFTWRPADASLPLAFMKAACLEGVKRALVEPLADGRRIAFIEVSVVDGSYHDRDTDEQSMGIAAYMAVRDALARAPFVDA